MDQDFDRHRQSLAAVNDGWNAESDSQDDASDDHLGKPVMVKAEIAAVADIEHDANQAKNRQGHSNADHCAFEYVFYFAVHLPYLL